MSCIATNKSNGFVKSEDERIEKLYENNVFQALLALYGGDEEIKQSDSICMPQKKSKQEGKKKQKKKKNVQKHKTKTKIIKLEMWNNKDCQSEIP